MYTTVRALIRTLFSDDYEVLSVSLSWCVSDVQCSTGLSQQEPPHTHTHTLHQLSPDVTAYTLSVVSLMIHKHYVECMNCPTSINEVHHWEFKAPFSF